MLSLIVLGMAATLSGLVVSHMIRVAPSLGLIDHPGEHKQHARVTPFVGGFGVFAAVCFAAALLGWFHPGQRDAWLALVLCAVVLFGVGLADDRWRLSARVRLVVQVAITLVMVFGAGVVIHNLGDLFYLGPIVLGLAAVPFTAFAAVGSINALNMVDGIDGLSGSIAAGTLGMIALVADLAGDTDTHLLAMALLGGVAGFLWFNLRFGRQQHARTFMGDNGSMLLGFVVAWLLITLTQGEHAIVPPVVALWIYAVPLFDTLCVIVRRLWLGKSPLSPDRNHLHHLLQRAGFRVEDTIMVVLSLHVTLGLFGIFAALAGVPEPALFIAFVVAFAGYLLVTARPWRFVPIMRRAHRSLGLTPACNLGVFIDHSSLEHAHEINTTIAPLLTQNAVFRTRIFQYPGDAQQSGRSYAIVQILLNDELAPLSFQHIYLRLVRRAICPESSANVRPYVQRELHNERRDCAAHAGLNRRSCERRVGNSSLLEESFTYVRGGRIVEEQFAPASGRHSRGSVSDIASA